MQSRRVKVTKDGTQYDLSAQQFTMLSRKKLKLPVPMKWNDEQRIRSLVKQGLFRKLNGAYVRTILGSVVYEALHARVANPKE